MKLNKSSIEDVMYGRKKSVFVAFFLGILSAVYGLAIALRRRLFDAGISKKKRLAQRVISVGNITLGGTGKTPAVMQIAGILIRHRKRPVVISRGYGRRDESAVLAVSDGQRVLVDARSGGDEPVLIGSKMPGLPVVVGSNRFKASLFAHDRFGNDIVILDDGFQHIGLHRDLDIVLVNGADPFGNGKLFPAGILREPLTALGRADAVLITGCSGAADIDAVKRAVARYSHAPVFTSRQTPHGLVDITGEKEMPLTALQGKRILAAAGIARPESFLSLLRQLGCRIEAERIFADHYEYRQQDLIELYRVTADKRIEMIVTTEKDAARLRALKPEGIWALRIELEIVEKEAWEEVLLNGA